MYSVLSLNQFEGKTTRVKCTCVLAEQSIIGSFNVLTFEIVRADILSVCILSILNSANCTCVLAKQSIILVD